MYKTGVAKRDITDRRKGLQMQGMADPRQKTTGVALPLFARAFVVEDPGKDVVIGIVVADIWACTRLLKLEVLKALDARQNTAFHDANLLISGTHTHSAPGGYAGYEIYDQPSGKVDRRTLKILTDGIADALVEAHESRAPGQIYLNNGLVEDCGRQRSKPAYDNNPPEERARYETDTDNSMQVLKFTRKTPSGATPVGMINWYAIHPTDLGQANQMVSGDNKGLASARFEQAMSERGHGDVVAAFANANCGDVSGNVGFGIPDGIHDTAHLETHATKQCDAALHLFDDAHEQITGTVKHWYKHKNFSSVRIKDSPHRTWPFALGLSFAAGSTEDSVSVYADPFTGKVVPVENVREGLTSSEASRAPYNGARALMSAAMSLKFSTTVPGALPGEITNGHAPKPILFAPRGDSKLAPSVLPIQCMRLGQFAVIGFPGELTSMAGRRLRARVVDALGSGKHPVTTVALGTYSNEYAQYVATKEEYDKQHYEGASTPFGPHTLAAFIQEFETLVGTGDPDGIATPKPPKSVRFYNGTYFTVLFHLSYVLPNGNFVGTDSGGTVSHNKYYHFKIPGDATQVKVYAGYQRLLDPWATTAPLEIEFDSGETYSVQLWDSGPRRQIFDHGVVDP